MIQQFSIESRKIKPKVITLANHKRRRKYREVIITRGYQMQLTRENQQRLPVTLPPLRSLEIRSTLFRCITHTTRVRLKLFDRQAEAIYETPR